MKTRFVWFTTTAACCALLAIGCGSRDEDVVVQQPDTVIEKETTVKQVPEERDTVVVKQQPATEKKTETKTETDVKVTVNQKGEKSAKATPTARPKSTPRPSQKKPSPTPRLTATPIPRPQRSSADLVLRGEVLQTSKVPDPKSVPYKEALVFTKYRVLEVQQGKYAPNEILVAHWGMRDRKLQPAARINKGDRHRLELVPLASQKDLQSVMRLDDTSEFELEPYFASKSP